MSRRGNDDGRHDKGKVLLSWSVLARSTFGIDNTSNTRFLTCFAHAQAGLRDPVRWALSAVVLISGCPSGARHGIETNVRPYVCQHTILARTRVVRASGSWVHFIFTSSGRPRHPLVRNDMCVCMHVHVKCDPSSPWLSVPVLRTIPRFFLSGSPPPHTIHGACCMIGCG